MRILLAGDCHGDKGQVNYLHQIALNEKITTIVQVGDFGYGWPEREPFIDYVSQKAVKHDITWYWLDGNHENFDALEEDVNTEAGEPQLMRPSLYYLPRGCTWEFDGVRFMALGGAYSIDKDYRVPHKSWWPQETITEADVARAKSRGKVDVLLTHDSPEGACPIVGMASFGYKADAMSKANRECISDVIKLVRPSLVVHGHMHHRYSVMQVHGDGWFQVEGLGRDGQRRDSWVIYDTTTRHIEDNKQS